MAHVRNYQGISASIANGATRDEAMRCVVDALWNGLHTVGVSWVGFYVDQSDEPDDRRLVLGPCRDKPACSPIGLHGVCGQSLLTRSVRIIQDVRTLGGNYVACDPRDLSEIVIPLIGSGGECWGVLDLDSWETAAFDESDAQGLQLVLKQAGLA